MRDVDFLGRKKVKPSGVQLDLSSFMEQQRGEDDHKGEKKPQKSSGGPKIIFYRAPGVVTYPDPGRKCPFRNCKCHFITNMDLEAHIETHWRKGEYGDWIFSDEYPELKRELMERGTFSRGGYTYMLSGGGKYITRRREGRTFPSRV